MSTKAEQLIEQDEYYVPCQEKTDDGYEIRQLPETYTENAGMWQARKYHEFVENDTPIRAFGYGKTKEEAKRNSLEVAKLNRARTVAKLLYSQNLALTLGHGEKIDPEVQKLVDLLSGLKVVTRRQSKNSTREV